MKSVTRFVKHGLHIPLQPDRIHENEWEPRFAERGLISTRRFPFPIGQVQQPPFLHGLETIREGLVEPVEDALGFGHHLANLLKWLKRRTVQWIDRHIPRPQ